MGEMLSKFALKAADAAVGAAQAPPSPSQLADVQAMQDRLLQSLTEQDQSRAQFMLDLVERLSKLRLSQRQQMVELEGKRAEQYMSFLERAGLIDLKLDTDPI